MADEERTEEGWEVRMAARARERRLIRKTEEYLRGMARWEEDHERDLAHVASWMTLGEAIDLLTMPGGGWACACIGGPDCCVNRYEIARRLHAAAHIAVKLVEDHTRPRIKQVCNCDGEWWGGDHIATCPVVSGRHS